MDTSLSAALPYRQFIDDGIHEGLIDLRGDGVLMGYHLRGPSPEQSDNADLAHRVRQLGSALVHLGTGDVVQVLFDRLPAPEPPAREYEHRAAAIVHAELQQQFAAQQHWLNISRLYLSHQYESRAKSQVRALVMAADGPKHKERREMLREQALRRFAAFTDAASGAIDLPPMTNVEMFRDLFMAVTYHDYPALLPLPHVRLNKVIGCEDQVNGEKPWINDWHLRPVTITLYPVETAPQLLAVLLQRPGHITISARFECLDSYDVQHLFEREQRYWNQNILGTFSKIIGRYLGFTQQAEQDGRAQLADLADAMADSQAGTPFGIVTITVIVRDRDEQLADQGAHDIIRECHRMGVSARLERLNAAEAVAGTWPGHMVLYGKEYRANHRKVPMTGYNFADLVLPASYWEGKPYIDSEMYAERTPTPLICGGGNSLVPFYWPTHINGIPHQVWFGPTGTGKSSILAALVCSYLGIPESRIHWLDLGYSSFVLTHLLGAQYHELGALDSTPLCPLALLDTDGGLEYLCGWFERMFKRFDFEMNERELEDFRGCLMKARRDGIRTLYELRASIHGDGGGPYDRIRRILQQYSFSFSQGGWGHIFNGEPTTTRRQRVTVYELQGLIGLGINNRASAPAMELILHNTVSNLDGKPTWIMADEFWSLLGDEVSAEYLFAGIRTLRRKNCGFVGFTQSTIEVANSPYRDLLLESFQGKVFLPNHDATNAYLRESYAKLGLNPHEIACIASARPRRDFFYKSAHGSRKASLELSPLAQAVCASTSYKDVQRARAMLKESPGELFVDAWVSERASGGQPCLPEPAETAPAMGWGARALVD